MSLNLPHSHALAATLMAAAVCQNGCSRDAILSGIIATAPSSEGTDYPADFRLLGAGATHCGPMSAGSSPFVTVGTYRVQLRPAIIARPLDSMARIVFCQQMEEGWAFVDELGRVFFSPSFLGEVRRVPIPRVDAPSLMHAIYHGRSSVLALPGHENQIFIWSDDRLSILRSPASAHRIVSADDLVAVEDINGGIWALRGHRGKFAQLPISGGSTLRSGCGEIRFIDDTGSERCIGKDLEETACTSICLHDEDSNSLQADQARGLIFERSPLEGLAMGGLPTIDGKICLPAFSSRSIRCISIASHQESVLRGWSELVVSVGSSVFGSYSPSRTRRYSQHMWAQFHDNMPYELTSMPVLDPALVVISSQGGRIWGLEPSQNFGEQDCRSWQLSSLWLAHSAQRITASTNISLGELQTLAASDDAMLVSRQPCLAEESRVSIISWTHGDSRPTVEDIGRFSVLEDAAWLGPGGDFFVGYDDESPTTRLVTRFANRRGGVLSAGAFPANVAGCSFFNASDVVCWGRTIRDVYQSQNGGQNWSRIRLDTAVREELQISSTTGSLRRTGERRFSSGCWSWGCIVGDRAVLLRH